MKVILKKLTEIHPYERNPRKNEEAVDYVANSIKEFGFKVPIVIDKNGIIVAGHTRYKAAKKMNLKEVPCVVADDLTEEQIKAYRLADNKVAEFSEWDFELLDMELENICEIDMLDFGFDFKEELETEEDDYNVEQALEEIYEPKTKIGDIYILGNHRLMCGDSTNIQDIKKLMNGNIADLVVTDPPYNVAYEGKTKETLTIKNDNMESEEFNLFLTKAFQTIETSLKKGGAFYIWYASREHINFESALNKVGLEVRQQLIWVKNTMVLGRQDYHWRHEPCLYGWKGGGSHEWYSDRKQTTVLEFDKPIKNSEHPTMKPLDLIGYQISNSSKEDDIVLDTFGGSGSTLIACEQLNRQCYTMELDPRYVDVIIDRWEQYTGNKARKE